MRVASKLLISLMCMILLTGCTTTEEVEKELPNELLKPDTTVFAKDDTTYRIVAENEYLELAYCEGNGHFIVTNKTDGSEFRSVTSEPAVNAEESLFEIYYIDERDNFSRMYSHADSVKKGQYQMEQIENGMKLTFTLGEMPKELFCPPAIKKDRFEEMLEKVEGRFAKTRFQQSYYLPNFEKIPEKTKGELLEKYPNIESDPLYVLTRNELTNAQQQEIHDTLLSIGYTQEDYEYDLQNSGELKVRDVPLFNVNMYVTLKEDELHVEMPIEEIIEVNGGKILSVSMLKNFASPEYGEKGQFILPDQSGSIMEFYNGKELASPYKVPVYGGDGAVPVEEQIFTPEQAYLPIFVTQYLDKGVLGVISEGEAFAEIHAWPGGTNTHAGVYPVFNVRRNGKAYLQGSTNAAEAFNLIQKELYDGSLGINYSFFTEDNNDLITIANTYAANLFGEEKTVIEPKVYLEFIGAVKEKKGEYALGGENLQVFTTVNQVREILEDLIEEGVDSLVVRLMGFGEDGLDSIATKPFKLNKSLGSEKELQELCNWAKTQEIEIYIDVDTQYVYGEKAFDKFSKYKDTAYLLTNEYGMGYPYKPSTMQLDQLQEPFYILNPVTVSQTIMANSEAVGQYAGVGIGLMSVGEDLNSDFQKNHPIERQTAMQRLKEDVANIAKTQKVLVNGANAHILPSVNHVSRVPVSKPKFDIADETVPFTQLILNGRVGYSDIPVNLSTNSPKFIMDTLAIGSGFTYVLTGEPSASLRSTTHSEYYSTEYSVWKQDILSKVDLLKECQTSLLGEIIDYQVIDEKVYKVVYENGNWILCNGSDLLYSDDNYTLEPCTYLIGGDEDAR